jgi:hypothetical protein
VQACGGLTNESGMGRAPGMSGSDDALPVLDERTRQLITNLIEASTQSLRSELQASFAARPAPSLGDGAGAARQNPSAESADGDVPNSAEIRAGAGAVSEVPARGGSGPVGNAIAPDAEDGDEEGEERTRKTKKTTRSQTGTDGPGVHP